MNAELRPFSLPLADPLETARGTIERREGFLFRLEAEDGAVGVGEATPLAGWTETGDECRQALEDAADAIDAGEDPESALSDHNSKYTPSARHALDLALADLHASRAGNPLYRWLGRSARVESVPVNATVGDSGVEETVSGASSAVDAGFECLKIKVGARSLSADIERIKEVADALPAVELRADANGAWSRQQAQQFLDAVGDRLAYVEQPLPATDLGGLAALSGPVALDETLAEVDFEDALDTAPEAVVLKPMALGGPQRTVEVAERAREEGVSPIVTTTIDGAVARTAAVHISAAIPDVSACGLATAKMLETDLGPDLAPVADGRAMVPQGEGNGTADTWRYHD
ncbi:mandelate racemase/muconate lactonizing enzyme family protein [Halorussus lipolyticus]|uniref:mandelate racemase/muconate lactonizing enzyme family protein n=1 Tax=Halorussus lipolyticus TaxID=3034024 RepID=UPI0023E87ECE|nr:o-succinylbenzoate synthase [Halorussus sp. DT80]